MQAESNSYIKKNGRLNVTDVVHTSGGGEIETTYIMHAVGPIWFENRREECTRQIAETFLNCFKYANKMLMIRSIAVPAISTGVYKAPLDDCVRAFLHAIVMFVHTTQREDLRLREVRLVNNDADATVTAITLLQALLEEGVKNLTRQACDVFQVHETEAHQKRSESCTYYATREQSSSPTIDSSFVLSKGIKRRPPSTDRDSDIDRRSPARVLDRRRSSSMSSSLSSHSRDSLNARVLDRSRSSSLSRSLSSHSGDSTNINYVTSEQSHCPTSATSSALSKGSHTSKVPNSGRGSPCEQYSSPTNVTTSTQSKGSVKPDSARSRGSYPSYDRNAVCRVTKTRTMPSQMTTCRDRDVRGALGTLSETSRKTSNQHQMRTGDGEPAARPKTSGYTTYGKSTMSELQTTRCNTHDDNDVGRRNIPIDLGAEGRSSYLEKILQLKQRLFKKKKKGKCAICLDVCKQPKQLQKCLHTFCTDCIRKHFRTKPTCPVCYTVYGEIQGTCNQPRSGKMTYTIEQGFLLPGYERENGVIVVTYTFPDGQQEACQPRPGRSYKGLIRECYLPNSVEGREILLMLKKAFDQRLVFTFGQSSATGAYEALTWNDIRHKTSVSGGPTKNGYPDPNYMKQVREDLAAKGITSYK